MQMYRQQVIGVQAIAQVLQQWEEPSCDWGYNTGWRLFNAATRSLNVSEKPTITRDLHKILDLTREYVQ